MYRYSVDTNCSVIIMETVVLLYSRTCADTFTYSLLYSNTLGKKRNIRSAIYVILEPVETPYVPSRIIISLNREWYAMVIREDRQW